MGNNGCMECIKRRADDVWVELVSVRWARWQMCVSKLVFYVGGWLDGWKNGWRACECMHGWIVLVD